MQQRHSRLLTARALCGGPHRYDGEGVTHHYSNKVGTDGSLAQASMTRIVSELVSCQESLPFHMSSSIFMRVDEENYQMVKCLITGWVHDRTWRPPFRQSLQCTGM
jgi:hypothetical protein